MGIRLTGLGAGSFSAQWEYKQKNEQVVRRVIAELEDYRVLNSRQVREDYDYCRLAAQKIRNLLNLEIPNVKMGGDIEASFKKMRRSARDFITAAGPESLNFSNDHRHFMACLEAMRVSIGTEIVWLAAEYKILMEDDFARSLPIRDLSWIATFEDENGNPA